MNISGVKLFHIFDVLAALVFAAIYFGVALWLFPLIFPAASHAILHTVGGIGAIIVGRASLQMFKSVSPKD